MNDTPLKDPKAKNCPWCGSDCMYLETDEQCVYIDGGLGFRIGADCDKFTEEFHSERNDTLGNDFGRTQWCKSKEEAIDSWNIDAVESVKCNHKNYW